ncbi:hypothetical protein [Kineococcus aurantiacus]|uniref:Uncharacterized protein n=1 Tax=Kineococcus aurantiacus TaxID=37633 RepID=A0A7Y9J2B4_9ACTN|nr:hypothetical protein [Kineococcus aurantiacus]NYD24036.1 hypothetical protein [Kineococcus aurantiacus]
MDSTTTATFATTGVVAGALVAAARVRNSAPTSPCVSWERSHASTRPMTTGGVRLLPAATAGLRHDKGAYGATSIPSSGPSTSSPPL